MINEDLDYQDFLEIQDEGERKTYFRNLVRQELRNAIIKWNESDKGHQDIVDFINEMYPLLKDEDLYVTDKVSRKLLKEWKLLWEIHSQRMREMRPPTKMIKRFGNEVVGQGINPFSPILNQFASPIKNPIERVKGYKKEAERLIYGNADYSTAVRKVLTEVGNARVSSARLVRVPVPDYLINILNVASLGDFKKKLRETEYDKLFHLAIVFETDKGEVLAEKNEVINVSKKIPKGREGQEEKRISVSGNPTINEILQRTQESMQDRYFKYSAYDNNCQNFILNVLKSNNLGTQSDYEWVKQDTEELFKNSPYLRKLANTVTDVAARITGKGWLEGEYYNIKTDANGNPISKVYLNKNLNKTGGLGDAERILAPRNGMSVQDWVFDGKTGQYVKRAGRGLKGGLIVKANPYGDW